VVDWDTFCPLLSGAPAVCNMHGVQASYQFSSRVLEDRGRQTHFGAIWNKNGTFLEEVRISKPLFAGQR